MQIVEDNRSKDEERFRMTLLPSSSSSTSTNFYVPITTVNMQPNRVIHKPYIQYHNNGSNNDNNDNDDNNNDDGDVNDNDIDNIEKEKMKQNANGSYFGLNYHLQIDRNSINILLKVAAALVLLCIAGCLMLQHLRINQLDYRIRRIELNSAHSIQVPFFSLF